MPVRAPRIDMFHQILIAHDGSDNARKAFDAAIQLAARLGARLRMICVEEEIPRHAEVIDELREEKDRADSYFGQLAEQCKVRAAMHSRSEEHTSELQSLRHLVCRLL